MNLSKKKRLASRTFGIGKNRIVFIDSRKNEIKEAITKQDMKDLMNSGAIVIKDIRGRRKRVYRKRRGPGKVKNKVNKRKREYVAMSRKLRNYASVLKKEGKISEGDFKEIRRGIRNSLFRSKSHLKLHIKSTKK